jgi:hypothetical protein
MAEFLPSPHEMLAFLALLLFGLEQLLLSAAREGLG